MLMRRGFPQLHADFAGRSDDCGMTGSLARLAAVAVIGLLATVASAPAAWGHGDEETTEGYLLVQQALGYLAHDTGMSGIDLAAEKVDDALESDDQTGVNVAELSRGRTALEAGDVAQARTLLQDSVQQAVAALPPATGTQTGTHEVVTELPGRPDLRNQDWLLLAASALAAVGGVWLAVVLRPRDTIRTLRARLLGASVSDSSDRVKGT